MQRAETPMRNLVSQDATVQPVMIHPAMRLVAALDLCEHTVEQGCQQELLLAAKLVSHHKGQRRPSQRSKQGGADHLAALE